MTQDERAKLVAALQKIAALDDVKAHERLALTGTYTAFDEPGSVEIAMEVLREISQPTPPNGFTVSDEMVERGFQAAVDEGRLITKETLRIAITAAVAALNPIPPVEGTCST